MHRIDSPNALPGGFFTEGDPMVPVPATDVSDDWLNAVQEEIAAVITAAEIALDKKDDAQLLAAILKLIVGKMPRIATPEINGLGHPDDTTIKIDITGKYSVPYSKIRLTADLHVYVRQDGSDDNDGNLDDTDHAWRTIGYAIKTIASKYDIGTFNVDIHVGAGSWTEKISLLAVASTGGAATLRGVGDTTILKLSTTGQLSTVQGSTWVLRDIQLECSGSGTDERLSVYGSKATLYGIHFTGTMTANGRPLLAGPGGIIVLNAGCSFAIANATCALSAQAGGEVIINADLTIDGTYTATAMAESCGLIHRSGVVLPTVSGSVNGARFSAQLNGVIRTFGGGTNYFPGSAAGATATGGQYA